MSDQASMSGAGLYRDNCAMCHGDGLDDGEFGPPLKGAAFHQRWSGKTVGDVYDYVRTNMPPASPGSLSEDAYWLLLKLVLTSNDISIDVAHPDLNSLKSIKIGN
jgi:mono/diheme cytochrome c family protein